MKKLIFIISLLAVLSPKLFAQFEAQENFSYPDGDSLVNHFWRYSGPLMTEYHRIKVTSPGLVFLDYAGSGIGRAAILDTTGIETLWKIFDIPGLTTGNVYVSLMINVKNANPAGQYFAGISPVGSSASGCTVYLKDSSESIALGLSKNLQSPIYTPAIYSKNITYLIVLKYTFIAGSSNDSVGLFIFDNALPQTEPIPDLKASNSSTDLINAGSVSIFQSIGNSPRVVIDGIYFRNSWDAQVLPVEIISFNSSVNKRDVILNWATSSESNNSGFEIEKQLVGNTIENAWVKSGFIKGNGTTALPQYYSFTDKGLNTGKYKYRLKQIDYNGNFEYYNLENEVEIGIPDEYYISQNYPNPFNPSTKIDFDLPEGGFVNIKIYNINGREIKTILNEFKAEGYYTIELSLDEITSGIYFYHIVIHSDKIQTGDPSTSSGPGFSMVKKMALVK